MSDSDAYLISKFRDMAMSDRTDMKAKTVAWIPDSNNGAYNGQIVFDLSALSTTSGWLSYNEAYIEIPYVIGLKGSVDIAAPINKNTITIKDGYHHLIDSIAVEFNQKTVCQVQSFTNVHTHFKMLTSSSAEDILKNRVSTGFYGEPVNDLTYSNAATVNGIGFINNTNAPSLRKTEITSNDLSTTSTVLPSITKSKVKKSGRSYCDETGAAGADNIYFSVIMATIKLRDITDFFDKIPLCKTSDIRLIITYNSISATVDMSAASLLSIDSYTQLSGHSCPVMMCAVNGTTGPAAKISIRSNIVKSGLGETPDLPINQCRLYVPTYKIADSVSLAMIQSFPTTTFEYNDIYTYTIPRVEPGTFTYTLTTGIVNPQYVVVIPYVRVQDIGAGIGNCSQYTSIFDSAPASSSAVVLSEFNVQLAGVNVFQANQRFDWEQFMEELSKINAINGNNSLGITSGILNMFSFQQGYRMYVADLRRRETSSDNVTKSIVITGVNTMDAQSSPINPPLTGNIELLCFVAYRKTLSINTSTGTVSE